MERPVETVFTRRFDRLVRRGAALLAGAFALSVSFTLWAIWPSNEAVGYRPAQPVAFPHDVMAGQVKIPCLYCHWSAESGPVAGIPTVEVCMNCHRYVQPRDERGNYKAMIATLLPEYADPVTGEPRKPIAWRKVHDLSDFAYFDHSRHTVGARLECKECHGPVENMREIGRIHSFKMGWCIDCHRLPPEEWRTDGRETRGPMFCSTCHR